ncbi:YicC family protein [Pusillimonas sp.]|uniref:YicC family protein n=1 Tax=Pusillimonas sp. TaxID=3040095 RepID=UPI0037CA7A3F
MIRSMTAFGAAGAESDMGSVTVEVRTVNSRYLDVNLRLPDELRLAEAPLREQVGLYLRRGKVDVRVAFARAGADSEQVLSDDYLRHITRQLEQARALVPDTPAPTLFELIKGANASDTAPDPKAWNALCTQAAAQALAELQANRGREGARLAQMMLECADGIADIVEAVQAEVPRLLDEHRQKLAAKLRDTLEAASPSGLSQISGEELSARIAQETSLFSLRIDVAEELARLRSHLSELQHILSGNQSAPATEPGSAQAPKTKKADKAGASLGKRLDFLFQEMNREANTLGSKASGIAVTRAAIDLKLLIEQMREQAQNIE